MNGVLGMTELLLETGLTATQRRFAETVQRSGKSLLAIINDILDFSKIEAGKLDIETIELDLGGNVDDVGSIMAFQAAAKGLELVVNVRPEVPARVLGDPQRIRQCLLNLVGNAIKFTERGSVTLRVEADAATRRPVAVEVVDTGIGIAPERQAAVFDTFEQADTSTTRLYGGTGLGLTIAAELIHLHGGTISLDDSDGRTRFRITIPDRPASEDAL